MEDSRSRPARSRSATHGGLSVACSGRGSGDGPGLDGAAAIAIGNLYLHHLGTSADQAGLDRLNRRGTPGVRNVRPGRNDTAGMLEG